MGGEKMLNKMKAIRFLSGKSQDELMIETGINQAKISRIERGYLNPTAEEKEKLAKALGTTTKELFREE